jgi:hypothetical protein
MTNELNRLLQEYVDYALGNARFTLPGVVEKYDYKTRRADVKPSLKRKLPDGGFAEFPVIPDVPVVYAGSRKYTIHFPLEKGDEVELRFCDRSTDVWRDKGDGGIEDAEGRRNALPDCFVTPGLQPVKFIAAPEDGLAVIHKTNYNGAFISSVIMNDGHIEALYKKKCRVLMEDDKITVNTEKSVLKLNADKFSEKNHLQSLYKILYDWIQENSDAVQVGNPHTHSVSPPDKLAYTKLQTRLTQLMEEG